MTLGKARELLQTQADFGGFYKRHSTKLVLALVSREPGQVTVDKLIADLRLDEVFQLQPGKIH